ncbi:MAG: flavin reductase family protein [Candidatus Binatia bacterium]|nr:flavin reductase family protein [Candidatus Binatia bacterium]
MAIDPRELRNVMGHFATGVTVITTTDKEGRPFGLTANAFTSLSLNPPLVLVCVDKTVDCYPCFEQSKVFVVNILTEAQEHLSRRFATKGIDKFAGVAYHTGECGAPVLEDTMGHIECKIVNAYEGGDHTIYIGEILTASASGDRPLLFFKGKYYHLPQ